MSEVKKVATRESYGNALVELGKEHENLLVLDADLAAATKTGVFKKAFPERHIDCGIAEANMTGIAAGLSTCGFVPFVSTFAMFAAGRSYAPPFVLSLSMIMLFGKAGIITRYLLKIYDNSVYGYWGIVIVQTLTFFPV